MDRTSRFQHTVPLSNGIFSKPSPIQNNGVSVKPLPPLILDRFRALVKEREEELRVFGGGAVSPLSTDEIVRLYEIVLSELTMNSKPIITDLTIIAGEQRAHGEGIADAICARIIEVQVDQKLPSLYLLDSIVKNIGKEYIKYFSARLPEVFCEAYAQVHPNMHTAMRHLFGTWSAVFPLSVLQKIEVQLQFPPSVNGQSSGLSSSRASESPRPTHGIHINPKYLEAQRPSGHSTVDTFGTEGVGSTGRAVLTTGLHAVKRSLPSAPRIMRSSSPFRIGHAGSLSPSLEEFTTDSSPKRVALRASPSRPAVDSGPSKVMGREEETGDWRKRNWQGSSNQQLKATPPYNHSSSVDLRGPRALISAYGMDEREKKLNHKNHMAEQLEPHGADQTGAIRTWQNTEEEEFDWEDMTPALADWRQSKDIYPSLPPPGNLTARQSFTNKHVTRPVTDYTGRGSIDKIVGVMPDADGPRDLTSQIASSFPRDSALLQHQQPQSHFNAKVGGYLSESRSFLTAGEQNPPVNGNFPNTDGKFGVSSVVSTPSSTYESPAPDIRSAEVAASTKAWHPAKFQNSQMPSLSTLPPRMQIGGQFGMKNAANVDQIHPEQHFGNTRSMSQVTLPHITTLRPGSVPLHLQHTAQPSLVQPNLLMAQEARQYLRSPYSEPIPSNAPVPPMNYRYLTQAHGPSGTTSSNIVSGVSSLPILHAPNLSFHVPGAALQSLPRGAHPGTTQASSICQNTGQIAPNPPPGPAFSGLISSLMAQGLISLSNQDSVGVEFDPDILKVRHESAITALYADLPRQCKSCGLRFKSQDEHSNHMDWHVNKNRTLKTRKAKPSPKWFVSVTMWLSGAESLGTEPAPGFLPAENTEDKEEDEEMAVPADEDQNACALCGDPFDDFYSDELEEWMYKGAIYMYAPAGATVGMDRSQLGPIVHAKCRSDSHGISSEEIKKDEGEPAEEGSQRKRLRS